MRQGSGYSASRHFVRILAGAAGVIAASSALAAPAGRVDGTASQLPIVTVQCGQSVPCPGGEFAPGGPGYGGPSGPLGAVGIGMSAPPENTYVEVNGRLLQSGVVIGRNVRIGRNVMIAGRMWPTDHVEWCSARYRSYDPSTDTYVSYSGHRKRCIGR